MQHSTSSGHILLEVDDVGTVLGQLHEDLCAVDKLQGARERGGTADVW